jgi:hypothetical protein
LLVNARAHNCPLWNLTCAKRVTICAARNGEYVDDLGIHRRLRARCPSPAGPNVTWSLC